MRQTPYPAPPSPAWMAAMVAGYGALALAAVVIIVLLFATPQSVEGLLVLGLWGGLTLPSALACAFGVLRAHYRFEWVGTWGIVAGTSTYLVVTILGTVALGPLPLLTSLPTILFFCFGIAMALGRAVQLSVIDMRARKTVLAEKAVSGEIPEVAVID